MILGCELVLYTEEQSVILRCELILYTEGVVCDIGM